MPPAAAKLPSDSEEDDSEDDEEKAPPPRKTTVPPVKNLPKGGEDTEPLLANAGAPSDAPPKTVPMSPRDKFRAKSGSTPRTPREKAPDLAVPDAEQAAAEAAAAADKAKAVAGAAVSELSNVRALTAEEQEKIKQTAKEEMEALKKAGEQLWQDILTDRPPSLFPLADLSKRMEKYIDLLISQIPEGKIPPSVEPLKPKIVLGIQISWAICGWIAFIGRWAYRIYKMLPHNLAQMLFGLALCYFGGAFMMTIAAAEAFRTMGAERAIRDLSAIAEEVGKVMAANDIDDVEDLDGDGVADVDDLTPPQLLQRKAIMIMTTVKEPQKIQMAAASLYAAGLAVVATLKLEFAQTVAMAIGVADMAKKPLVMAVQPKLEIVLPPPTHQWIRPTIETALQLTAVMVAMFIQQIISAFYSALRGGKLFSGGLFNILHDYAKKGVILCPGVVGPDFDPENSILDEIIGWIIMSFGLYYQLSTGFSLPFPFDLLLAPVTILEWFLKAQVVAGALEGKEARMLGELGFDPTRDGSLTVSLAEGCVRWANCSCALAGGGFAFGVSGFEGGGYQ